MRQRLSAYSLFLVSLLWMACAVSAYAQTREPSLGQRLFEGRIEAIDTIGVRRFVDHVDTVRTDSAEVYFNVRGEPVAWRAWIDGEYHAYWQPYGHFLVSDSALIAIEIFKSDRKLLEMLEGLELVEQAAKKSR